MPVFQRIKHRRSPYKNIAPAYVASANVKKRKPLQKTLFTILSNPLNLRSIQLNPLPCVAYCSKVAHEHLLRDYNCGGVVVGMERERGHIPKVGIQKQMHMILLIVDQSKRRYRAWFESQVFHHSAPCSDLLFRSRKR